MNHLNLDFFFLVWWKRTIPYPELGSIWIFGILKPEVVANHCILVNIQRFWVLRIEWIPTKMTISNINYNYLHKSMQMMQLSVVPLKMVADCMMQLAMKKEIDLIRLTIPAFKMTFHDILVKIIVIKNWPGHRSLLAYFEITLNGSIMNRNYFVWDKCLRLRISIHKMFKSYFHLIYSSKFLHETSSIFQDRISSTNHLLPEKNPMPDGNIKRKKVNIFIFILLH